MSKKRFLSLAVRNSIAYFVLFTAALFFSGILLFSYSAKEILMLTNERLVHTGELVKVKFASYLENAESDLDQLVYSPLVERYAKQPDSANLDLLNDSYLAYLSSNKSYFQVRLIEMDSGMEVIRVEQIKGQSVIVAQPELQNKSNRDYFSELANFPNDSLYFSKIDLNKEYGIISKPKTPTLRIAKKIQSADHKFMVIININLQSLFDEMLTLLPYEYELRLFDQNGHYLIHPDTSKTFTFEYNQPPFLQEEYSVKQNPQVLSSGLFSANKSENNTFEMPFSRNGYRLSGMITVKQKDIFESFYAYRKNVILAIVIVAAIFLLIAFLYMKTQSTKLKRIIEQLKSFAQNPMPKRLSIKRSDEIGELSKVVEQMSDKITQSQHQKEAALKEAQKAYQEKNEFLENMSHEIRNPLQSILGTVDILEQNKIGTQQVPFFKALKFSAKQLKSLVTDVLDYNQIKNKEIELKPDWHDLVKFLDELVAAVNYQSTAKKITVLPLIEEEIKGKLFYFDDVRLYQILNNLLTNAVKFSPKNSQVQLIVKRDEKETTSLSFAVVDQGKGISQQEIERITERNYTSNYTDGAGLGLAIVKELLFLFNEGDLSVVSQQNEGSTFSFVLKFEEKAKKQNFLYGEYPSILYGELPVILIIEDDPQIREWYSYQLTDFNIKMVQQPEQATDDFDILITDLNFENRQNNVTQYIRNWKERLNKNQFILVVSAADTQVETPFQLKKPVNKQEFQRMIKSLVLFYKLGNPVYEYLYADYDYNKELISNVLAVLVEEWKKNGEKIVEAIEHQDKTKFESVVHKLLATLRRFEMSGFEHFLTTIGEHIDTDNEKTLELLTNEAQLVFDFYSHVFNYVHQHLDEEIG